MKNLSFVLLLFVTKVFVSNLSYASNKNIEKIFLSKLNIRVQNVNKLKGGFSGGHVFKVKAYNNHDYVIKFTNSDDSAFKEELYSAQIASDNNFGPHLYLYNREKKFYIVDFLQEEKISEKQRASEELYVALATLLRNIHTAPINNGNNFTIFEQFDKILKSQKPNINPNNLAIHRQIKKFVDNQKNNIKLERATVHNDLHPRNMLFLKGKFYIIDAKISKGDPYYDLATVAIFWCFDKKSEDILLKSYFQKRPSLQQLQKFNIMKKLTMLLYALKLEYTSPGSFDYDLSTKLSVEQFFSSDPDIDSTAVKMQAASILVKNGLK